MNKIDLIYETVKEIQQDVKKIAERTAKNSTAIKFLYAGGSILISAFISIFVILIKGK